MPIYSYRCTDCGHAEDVLQKMSDSQLVTCPACGHESYRKQVTAAGFQLKGSGWYVTDFRNPQTKEAAKPKPDATGEAPSAKDGTSGDAKATDAPAAAAPKDTAPAKAVEPQPSAMPPAAPASGGSS